MKLEQILLLEISDLAKLQQSRNGCLSCSLCHTAENDYELNVCSEHHFVMSSEQACEGKFDRECEDYTFRTGETIGELLEMDE